MVSHRPTRGRTSFLSELGYLLWELRHVFSAPRKVVSTFERLINMLGVALIAFAILAHLVELAYPHFANTIDFYSLISVSILMVLVGLLALLERLHLIPKFSDDKTPESPSDFVPPLPEPIPIFEQLTAAAGMAEPQWAETTEPVSSISSVAPVNSEFLPAPPHLDFALKGGVIPSKANAHSPIGTWKVVQKATE